jgi:hypothetical protein
LGVPEETKGYVVFLPQDKKVIVTQHVKYIQTLSEAQNASLLKWRTPEMAELAIRKTKPLNAIHHLSLASPLGLAAKESRLNAFATQWPPALKQLTKRLNMFVTL